MKPHLKNQIIYYVAISPLLWPFVHRKKGDLFNLGLRMLDLGSTQGASLPNGFSVLPGPTFDRQPLVDAFHGRSCL